MAEEVISKAFVEAFHGSIAKMLNPPVVLRDRCRYCGQAQTQAVETLALRHQSFPRPNVMVAYAHRACVERERE